MRYKNMNKPKIGLLPLYLELYDKACPDRRPKIEAFYKTISGELEKSGLAVVPAPVCRLKKEFQSAIRKFEKARADAIVTLHLAYSPSLESADVLASTKLPVIILDTTPSFEFGPGRDSDGIMFNHGIHGVQDMCNMLLRKGKPFEIEAGHWRRSDVLSRVVSLARSAKLAASMRSARVGIVGRPFKGMGDFAVPSSELKRNIGISICPYDVASMKKRIMRIGKPDVEAEIEAVSRLFAAGRPDNSVLRPSILAGLAVRRWIEMEKLTAFTMNFLDVTESSGIPTVPFLEASLAMARGIGYAGEGDVLTAALVGALLSIYPETTFAEMFCPDWKGNRVFLTHMGEINVSLIDGKSRLRAPPFPFADVPLPVRPAGCLKGGEAVFVNLAPVMGGDHLGRATESFRLIVTPGKMVHAGKNDRMRDVIRGWFRPDMKLADFLAAYSRHGGTHHAALVYGGHAGEIMAFGKFMGWETVVLGVKQ